VKLVPTLPPSPKPLFFIAVFVLYSLPFDPMFLRWFGVIDPCQVVLLGFAGGQNVLPSHSHRGIQIFQWVRLTIVQKRSPSMTFLGIPCQMDSDTVSLKINCIDQVGCGILKVNGKLFHLKLLINLPIKIGWNWLLCKCVTYSFLYSGLHVWRNN
jgi:hypothetical protein